MKIRQSSDGPAKVELATVPSGQTFTTNGSLFMVCYCIGETAPDGLRWVVELSTGGMSYMRSDERVLFVECEAVYSTWPDALVLTSFFVSLAVIAVAWIRWTL